MESNFQVPSIGTSVPVSVSVSVAVQYYTCYKLSVNHGKL